jgi:putative ABC transport system permease protein
MTRRSIPFAPRRFEPLGREQAIMLMHDLRHAVRHFSRTPLVTITAVLTISLGVAASTAIFSLVYGVLLRPLPYPQSEELVELFEVNPKTSEPIRVSTLNYLSWAERARSLEAIAAFGGNDVTLTEHGDPQRLLGLAATASMSRVLGLSPLVGRTLRAEDERPGSRRVAMLSEPLWRAQFGGDAGIVGRLITLDGEPYEVIGVVPDAFREVGRAQVSSLGAPQIFLPLTIDAARENRGNRVMRVVGRLRDGASVERAREEMGLIAAALGEQFPASNKGWRVQVESVYETMLDERVKPSLLVLLAAVGMMLLIACANVANVLLARGIAREREFALRTAVGAGRARLIRQIVVESVLLAMISGVCGLVLAAVAVQPWRGNQPPTRPRADDIKVDAIIIAIGIGVTFVCGLFIGLAPAVRSSRVSVIHSFAAQGGRGVAGGPRTLLRHGIVVGQLAVATMLLVSAVLLVQSFVRLQQVPLGFEPAKVITTRISLPRSKYPDPAQTREFYTRLLGSLDGLPNLERAAVGLTAPFGLGVRATGRVRDRARATLPDETPLTAVEHVVSPEYFRVLGIPLRAGRSFGPQDVPGAPLAAVLSAGLARQLWPDGQAVGRMLEWNGVRPLQVVGVVGDIRGADETGGRGGGLARDPRNAVYVSAVQIPQRTMTLLVQTSSQPAAVASMIARAVHEIDASQPVGDIRRLQDWVDESGAEPRFTATVIGGFAVVALLLAAVGVYGVISYSVARRTPEIGVRLAMGAQRTEIMRLVLQNGVAWAVPGIALGLLGAFATGRVLGTLLFEVRPGDPLVYSAVAVGLGLVALLACCVPALNATRIDPLTAMRTE